MATLLTTDRDKFLTVPIPIEKRCRAESLLKRNAQIPAYPKANCHAMSPKQVAAEARDLKEIERETKDSSSGSEHVSESTFFSDVVCGFMDFDQEVICSRPNCSNGNEELSCENEPEGSHPTQILDTLVSCMTESELYLLCCVKDAVESEENIEVYRNKSCLRRAVMKQLKALGYNTGVCKSRCNRVGNFPSGEYEYMDVISEEGEEKSERLLVDIDFRAQFEMARPTREYSAMVGLLPNVFVGKAKKLKDVVKIMCKASERSLEKKTMHIPPWRTYRYMRSKWLGSYRRTTNPISRLPPSASTLNPAAALQQKGFEISFQDPDLREWKPPSVNLGSKKPAINEGGKVSGLASALIRAGLTKSLSIVQPTQ